MIFFLYILSSVFFFAVYSQAIYFRNSTVYMTGIYHYTINFDYQQLPGFSYPNSFFGDMPNNEETIF